MFGLKPSNRPPKLAERILSWIVPDEWQTPLGDFEEFFHALVSEKGTIKAWLWYWGQIFILIPGKIKNSCYWMTIMLKNHFTIALRNILKHKGYSFIRISGLAVGMAAFILVMLYIQHESDFDTFNENYERIYRVEQIKKNKDIQTRVTKTPLSLAQDLRDKYPEIVQASRMLKVNGHLYYGKKHRYLEEDGLMADPPVFEIFSFSFLEGDMETALKEPFSIVLTEDLARKYFGNKDPIGKFITFEKQYDCKVTGVIKNPPFQSHFKSRFIISLSSAKEMYGMKPDDEAQNRVFTYVLLPGNHNYQQVQEKSHDSLNKRSRGMESRLFLNPLSNLYFDTEASVTIGPTNSRILVYIFLIIGFFTLLVAMINTINLSAADSTTRAKEVGIRKALGSHRRTLIMQYLTEFVLISYFAVLIAVLLVNRFIPEFNQLMGSQIVLNPLNNMMLFLFIFMIPLAVGIISGFYPAIILSSLQIIKVLKETFSPGMRRRRLLKLFVIFQYLVSVIFIMGSLVVYMQVNYLKNIDLGFTTDNILYQEIDTMNGKRFSQIAAFKNELLKNGNIKQASLLDSLPYVSEDPMVINWEGAGKGESVRVFRKYVDSDFINMFGIQLAVGRNFSTEFPSDRTGACLINETAARMFGWENPVGKRLDSNRLTVIGVVKDFHNVLLNYQIEPLILKPFNETGGGYILLSVKIAPGNISETLKFIKKEFTRFFPYELFNFRFIDENLRWSFKLYDNLIRAICYLSLLSIFIASLGLFALVSISAREKTKEIGIRKVFGASARNIMFFLSKDLFKLIVVANLIAWPIAYYAMSGLLQAFAYRIGMNWWFFLTSGLFVLVTAIISVFFRVFKSATSNPVITLRYQ